MELLIGNDVDFLLYKYFNLISNKTKLIIRKCTIDVVNRIILRSSISEEAIVKMLKVDNNLIAIMKMLLPYTDKEYEKEFLKDINDLYNDNMSNMWIEMFDEARQMKYKFTNSDFLENYECLLLTIDLTVPLLYVEWNKIIPYKTSELRTSKLLTEINDKINVLRLNNTNSHNLLKNDTMSGLSIPMIFNTIHNLLIPDRTFRFMLYIVGYTNIFTTIFEFVLKNRLNESLEDDSSRLMDLANSSPLNKECMAIIWTSYDRFTNNFHKNFTDYERKFITDYGIFVDINHKTSQTDIVNYIKESKKISKFLNDIIIDMPHYMEWYKSNDSNRLKISTIFYFSKYVVRKLPQYYQTFVNDTYCKNFTFNLSTVNEPLPKMINMTKTDSNVKMYKKYVDDLGILILEALHYNGLLSKFVNNTDDITIRDVIDIGSDSYYFATNKKYIDESCSECPFVDLWKTYSNGWKYTYAMNWVSQINFYHRFIHKKVILITGGTGVGKSTQSPKLLNYCSKAINFNPRPKLICTQPRIAPTINNANIIGKQMGLDIRNSSFLQYKYSGNSFYYNKDVNKFIRFVTDGTLYEEISKNILLLLKDHDKYIDRNVYDIVCIDEAHEHNTNMDMILTLMKYCCAINNGIKLVIISATMDDDEKRYRSFYETVEDISTYPLYIHHNRRMVDRRVHISKPGQDTQYIITEHFATVDDLTIKNYYEKAINKTVEVIENSNYKGPSFSPSGGHLLLFLTGEDEILRAIEELRKLVPSNVMVRGYYSRMLDEEKTFVDSIENNLKEYNIKHNTSYNRVIIIATNVAEASITIDNLLFVVDIGYAKVDSYDPITNIQNLDKYEISWSSSKQRRGRVGRKSDGTIYYLYTKDRIINNKTMYKISQSNITSTILSLFPIKKIEEFHEDYYINFPLWIINFMNKDYEAVIVQTDNGLDIDSNITNKDMLDKEIKIDNKLIVKEFYNVFVERYTHNKSDYVIDIVYNKWLKHGIATPLNKTEGFEYSYIKDNQAYFYLIHPDENIFVRDISMRAIEFIIYTDMVSKEYYHLLFDLNNFPYRKDEDVKDVIRRFNASNFSSIRSLEELDRMKKAEYSEVQFPKVKLITDNLIKQEVINKEYYVDPIHKELLRINEKFDTSIYNFNSLKWILNVQSENRNSNSNEYNNTRFTNISIFKDMRQEILIDVFCMVFMLEGLTMNNLISNFIEFYSSINNKNYDIKVKLENGQKSKTNVKMTNEINSLKMRFITMISNELKHNTDLEYVYEIVNGIKRVINEKYIFLVDIDRMNRVEMRDNGLSSTGMVIDELVKARNKDGMIEKRKYRFNNKSKIINVGRYKSLLYKYNIYTDINHINKVIASILNILIILNHTNNLTVHNNINEIFPIIYDTYLFSYRDNISESIDNQYVINGIKFPKSYIRYRIRYNEFSILENTFTKDNMSYMIYNSYDNSNFNIISRVGSNSNK